MFINRSTLSTPVDGRFITRIHETLPPFASGKEFHPHQGEGAEGAEGHGALSAKELVSCAYRAAEEDKEFECSSSSKYTIIYICLWRCV